MPAGDGQATAVLLLCRLHAPLTTSICISGVLPSAHPGDHWTASSTALPILRAQFIALKVRPASRLTAAFVAAGAPKPFEMADLVIGPCRLCWVPA